MRTWDPVALECLAAVVEEGSFERAALRRQMSQSAVSQRLLGLESQIGQPLLVRTRPLRPTTAGQMLLRHARKLRALRADLGQELQQLSHHTTRAPCDENRISIAVDTDSLATWVMPALDRLGHQGHMLEVVSDDHRPPHEWLQEGLVHGCVTTQAQAPSGCTTTALGSRECIAVAQTAYAARCCPLGLGVHNFRDLPFVALTRRDDSQARFVADLLRLPHVKLQQIYMPSAQGRLAAVLSGWGVGILPKTLAHPHIARGELVNVAPDHTLSIPLYWQRWAIDTNALAHLSDALSVVALSLLRQKPPAGAH